MSTSIWEVFSIFSLALVSPFAGAAEPVNMPLPQTVDYAQYIRTQIGSAGQFSNDPLAEHSIVAGQHTGQPIIEAFIINYKHCVIQDDVLVYRLLVRNRGEGAADNVVVVLSYPNEIIEYNSAMPPPAEGDDPRNGTVTWNVGTLQPGEAREFLVTFSVVLPEGSIGTEITVTAGDRTIISSHVLPGCVSPPSFTEGELPDKQPVIICDPGERNCTPVMPDLGFTFRQVASRSNLQPIICHPSDPDPLGCVPNLPALGVRFAEAVADIIPGDCRILGDSGMVGDDIITTPAYQDAFDRRANPAAALMMPLHETTLDFKRLVHENDLLGIVNQNHAREVLLEIYARHWQRISSAVRDVLDGSRTTDSTRALVDNWEQDWQAETRAAQQDLESRYNDMQRERKEKFDPVADQAIENAESAIMRACGPPPSDGGLRAALLGDPENPAAQNTVKNRYEESLDERLATYETTQERFVNPDSAWLPDTILLPERWQSELREALDAFDDGDEVPLKDFLQRIPTESRVGFNAVWQRTYKEHAKDDRLADENIRLNHFETALETPKSMVVDCAKENVFAPPVELTWCESGDFDQFILRDAPPMAKRDRGTILPPRYIEGGYDADIDPQRVVGLSCGGRRGDPFWSYDCSCSCNELIEGMAVGNIRFCQSAGAPPDPGDDNGTTLPDHPPFIIWPPNLPSPQFDLAPDTGPETLDNDQEARILPIIRHDLSPVTTREECLRETERHTHPDPEDEWRIRF